MLSLLVDFHHKQKHVVPTRVLFCILHNNNMKKTVIIAYCE